MTDNYDETPPYVVQALQRSGESLADIPGILGHVLILRDPDGASRLPEAAVACLSADDAEVVHASYHALEAMILADRSKPADLGEPVADLMRERLEAWTARAAEIVEASIEEAPERARALLVKYEAKDKAVADAYIAQAADTARAVAAALIGMMREDLARSLDLMADGAASLVWERANGPICGGGHGGAD